MNVTILYNLIIKIYTGANNIIAAPQGGNATVHEITMNSISYTRPHAGPFSIDFQNLCNFYNAYKGRIATSADIKKYGITGGTEVPAMGILVDVGLTKNGFISGNRRATIDLI